MKSKFYDRGPGFSVPRQAILEKPTLRKATRRYVLYEVEHGEILIVGSGGYIFLCHGKFMATQARILKEFRCVNKESTNRVIIK